jgi:hypothetical protein
LVDDWSLKSIDLLFYYSGNKEGDVALFKVAPEELNEEYRDGHPMMDMKLASGAFDVTGRMCNVSGWGHTQEGSHQAPHVLQVKSQIQLLRSGVANGPFLARYGFSNGPWRIFVTVY